MFGLTRHAEARESFGREEGGKAMWPAFAVAISSGLCENQWVDAFTGPASTITSSRWVHAARSSASSDLRPSLANSLCTDLEPTGASPV